MGELSIDGVKQHVSPLPRCSRCKQYSYIVYRNKKGALVCHRCRRAKAVHKSDMADPEEQLLRGQSPKWEEE
jgi:hypothetical protein